ncbi:hypothetical protein IEQ34_010397 [Dendrobium chrysotoxum]|uniref:Uncharacterized protein n=1 Tax=Dendrobium chrysotoxum TaxID=161865 RepID=A0AAV7H1R8_DENCH|nr:hypothetical protein IEQ34_010397 [Dendrobium chrysotoxum]
MDRLLKQARSSGSLNLSNRSLREVPNEVYKNLEAVGEDEKWWEGVELQKLILAHNELEVLREDAFFTKIIGCVIQLANLYPRRYWLFNFISKTTNNSIARLPDELAKCLKLIKVDIEGNKLTVIPENILRCWTILTEFNAARNLLTTFPDSIGVLSKLIRLDFHQNKILLIPSSIIGCCSLAEFYMGTNLLSSLPEELGALSRLGTLDLHSNQLKEFPVEACKLQLSVLDLSNNSLSSLPPEIGNMTSLRKLLLNGNPIRTIRSSLVSGPTLALLKYLRSRLSSTAEAPGSSSSPIKVDVIAEATRLSLSSKELSLSGLGLTTVPSTVWETDEVVKVDLSRNSITELPNEMTTCSYLQVLILSGNKITQWPGVILSSLPSLSSLKLDNNPLSKIPPGSLEALAKLEILDLSGNASSLLDSSAFPLLPQLKELHLRRMKLSHIPTSILSSQQLRVLDLNQNLLVSLPEDVRNLTCLQELDLSNNNIAALPSELGLLESHLQVLKLDGNPLRSIRRPVLDRGTKAILKYLKDKLPEQ